MLPLIPLLTEITVVVTAFTAVGLVTIVGPGRLWEFRGKALDRFLYLFPYLLMVGCVLVVNSLLRDIGPPISWGIGWEITNDIYALEGTFVAWVQSFSAPVADMYFSYIYIYGYIFLLLFPLLAYFVLNDNRPVREATFAYALNYGIGLICYVLFIAYGPRNLMPDLVDQLLYVHWPEANLLTSAVNANVNVFPSLHTSLAATVALLAFRTRDEYPLWAPVSAVIAGSVIISTMYLGIHWLTDVVAGIGLAVISVAVAMWLTSPSRKQGWLYTVGLRLRAPVDSLTRTAVDRLSADEQSGHDPSQAE
jgi:membrane-associated phospholipid phosphatase